MFTVLRGRFGFQWVLIAIMLVDGATTGNGEAQVSVSFFARPQQKAYAKAVALDQCRKRCCQRGVIIRR